MCNFILSVFVISLLKKKLIIMKGTRRIGKCWFWIDFLDMQKSVQSSIQLSQTIYNVIYHDTLINWVFAIMKKKMFLAFWLNQSGTHLSNIGILYFGNINCYDYNEIVLIFSLHVGPKL